jgi:hypothetical protein
MLLLDALTNDSIAYTFSNPISLQGIVISDPILLLSSSSTFSNLFDQFNQSDTYRKEEPEIYDDDNNEDNGK